jgi:multiple sugar transport system substrate-binding protein
MIDATTRHRNASPQRLNRRRLFGAAGAAGAAGAGLAISLRFDGRAAAQSTPVSDLAASLAEWGFNATETNPLAFARLQAFQAAYPGVTIEISPESDVQRILTAAVSDTLPDLLWLGRDIVNSYVSRGQVLRPIDDLVARDGYDLSRFYPAAIQEASSGGQLYGIPGGMDVVVLWANTDALAEAGITDPSQLSSSDWDQLTSVGTQLTRKTGDAIDRWGFDSKIQDGQFYTWALANGAKLLGGDDGLQPNFNSAEVADLITKAKASYDNQGGFQNYEAFRSSWQNDEQFARGQVAITAYQNWLGNINAVTTPNLNFTVQPIHPSNDPTGIAAVSGGNSWCITAGSKNVDAAWEFIKFMHSDETWMIGARAVRAARDAAGAPYLPSLTGVPAVDQRQIDELYTPIAPQFDDAVQLFPQVLAASTTRALSPSPYAQQLDQIIFQTGVLPALRGEKPVQDALDAAQSEAENAVSGF